MNNYVLYVYDSKEEFNNDGPSIELKYDKIESMIKTVKAMIIQGKTVVIMEDNV